MKFEQQSNFPRDVWPRPGASQAKCHLSELWQWSWIKTNQRVLTVTPPLGWLIQFGRRLIGAEDTSDRGGRTRAASFAVSPACFQASAAKLTWLAGASLYVLTVAQRCFVVKRGCGWGRGVTEEGREGKKKRSRMASYYRKQLSCWGYNYIVSTFMAFGSRFNVAWYTTQLPEALIPLNALSFTLSAFV